MSEQLDQGSRGASNPFQIIIVMINMHIGYLHRILADNCPDLMAYRLDTPPHDSHTYVLVDASQAERVRLDLWHFRQWIPMPDTRNEFIASMKVAKEMMRASGVPFTECEALLGEIETQYERIQRIAIVVPDDSIAQELRLSRPFRLDKIWIEEAKSSSMLRRKLDAFFEYVRSDSDDASRKLRVGEVDEFWQLRQFARKKLKGNERSVLEAICDGKGELKLVDLTVLCEWDVPIESAWNSLRMRLNQKLKSQGWKLKRLDSTAHLSKIDTD